MLDDMMCASITSLINQYLTLSIIDVPISTSTSSGTSRFFYLTFYYRSLCFYLFDRFEVLAHCDLDLHFLNSSGWLSYHMHIGHMSLAFVKILFKTPSNCYFNWFWVLNLKCMCCTYLSLVCSIFHSFTVSIEEQKFLFLIGSNLSVFLYS